jgi:hypothetical protein
VVAALEAATGVAPETALAGACKCSPRRPALPTGAAPDPALAGAGAGDALGAALGANAVSRGDGSLINEMGAALGAGAVSRGPNENNQRDEDLVRAWN